MKQKNKNPSERREPWSGASPSPRPVAPAVLSKTLTSSLWCPRPCPVQRGDGLSQVRWKTCLFCFSEQTKLKTNLGSSQSYLETEWILILAKSCRVEDRDSRNPSQVGGRARLIDRSPGACGEIPASGNKSASTHWAFSFSLLEV